MSFGKNEMYIKVRHVTCTNDIMRRGKMNNTDKVAFCLSHNRFIKKPLSKHCFVLGENVIDS